MTLRLGARRLCARQFGPTRSIFSTSGVHQFGYFQEQLHNLFMLLIAPTLFWHRVGQITVGALAMAAIYTVYARLVAPRFGLLVAACAMSVSVMITHTYCSYPLIDGIACGNAILAVGLWIRRDPDSRRAWLVFGFLCGFMLFLTPTAWFMALCVAAWLGPLVLWRRWPLTHPAIAAGMALIAASPILLQWGHGQGGQLFSLVEDARWSSAHLLHLFEQTVTIPFSSDMEIAGAFGAQLPPVFRWLFIPGILLTPLFSRRVSGSSADLRLLCGARAHPDRHAGTVSRCLREACPGVDSDGDILRLSAVSSLSRSLVVVLLLVALWASFGAYNMVYGFRPGRTGYNFYDGVVEAHQRLHASTVCVVVNNAERAQTIAKGSEIDVCITPRHICSRCSIRPIRRAGTHCVTTRNRSQSICRPLGIGRYSSTTRSSCAAAFVPPARRQRRNTKERCAAWIGRYDLQCCSRGAARPCRISLIGSLAVSCTQRSWW